MSARRKAPLRPIEPRDYPALTGKRALTDGRRFALIRQFLDTPDELAVRIPLRDGRALALTRLRTGGEAWTFIIEES